MGRGAYDGLTSSVLIRLFIPLKCQEKLHLKMSSAEVVCCKYLPNITDELSIEAKSVDPEQAAPI